MYHSTLGLRVIKKEKKSPLTAVEQIWRLKIREQESLIISLDENGVVFLDEIHAMPLDAPVSSEYATHTTVEARFRIWRSGKSA